VTGCEQVKNRPLGHVWDRFELRDFFELVAGGVAYPGKRPGFAVVAGLRPVREEGQYEIHVLDEAESKDLGELLRLCRSLIPKYQTYADRDERFRWYGNGNNTAAQALIREINERTKDAAALYVSSSPILDMETPYSFIISRLRQYTAEGQKSLFLRGSRTAAHLTDVQPDEMFALPLGSFPAVEALTFVVEGLRAEADSILWRRKHPRGNNKNYNPLDGFLMGCRNPLDFA
jgi:hypothetical protein